MVFHLAALIAIPYSYVAPRSYVRTNIEGTLNVMEACRRQRSHDEIVHTSTSGGLWDRAIHAPSTRPSICRANRPIRPRRSGRTRSRKAMPAPFDLPVVTVRPFNTYGPRQSARAFIPARNQPGSGQWRGPSSARLSRQRDLTFVSNTVKRNHRRGPMRRRRSHGP